MALIDSFNETKAALDVLRDTWQSQAKQVFDEGAQQLFAEDEQLESFGWQQYTPYFNDGDTCTFSAHIDPYAIKINGRDEDYYYGDGAGTEPEQWELDAGKAVSALLGALGDDNLLAIFGDHAEIVVTRDGVEVEEVYHD